VREIRRILQDRVCEGFNIKDRKDAIKQTVTSLPLWDEQSANTASKRKNGGGSNTNQSASKAVLNFFLFITRIYKNVYYLFLQ
jgi:hypothetical protein